MIGDKDVGRSNVVQAFSAAAEWTAKTGVETYFGAWMPQDNEKGSITTEEAIEFSKYFIKTLRPIPWSLNVLDVYYNTKTATWKTGTQKIQGQTLDMPKVLKAIESAMKEKRKDEEAEAQNNEEPLYKQLLDVVE